LMLQERRFEGRASQRQQRIGQAAHGCRLSYFLVQRSAVAGGAVAYTGKGEVLDIVRVAPLYWKGSPFPLKREATWLTPWKIVRTR
jgi:hypothetical protein